MLVGLSNDQVIFVWQQIENADNCVGEDNFDVWAFKTSMLEIVMFGFALYLKLGYICA